MIFAYNAIIQNTMVLFFYRNAKTHSLLHGTPGDAPKALASLCDETFPTKKIFVLSASKHFWYFGACFFFAQNYIDFLHKEQMF